MILFVVSLQILIAERYYVYMQIVATIGKNPKKKA